MTGERFFRQTFSITGDARIIICCLFLLLFPGNMAIATQLHVTSEGIITHQIGHTMFLFSMGVLIFTIRGKRLDSQKGWQMIQLGAFFFILWNLDALFAHMLDNQIMVVSTQTLSFSTIEIYSESPLIAWVYYFLKLDHLLCVPAMFFVYRGLSVLVQDQRKKQEGAL